MEMMDSAALFESVRGTYCKQPKASRHDPSYMRHEVQGYNGRRRKLMELSTRIGGSTICATRSGSWDT